MLGDRDVLAGPACVRRDQYVDEWFRLWIVFAGQPERDVGEPPGKAIACHLRIAEVLQATDDVIVPGDDRRHAKIHVACLAIQAGAEPPSCREHGDHMPPMMR
jgi:hypothetical protein